MQRGRGRKPRGLQGHPRPGPNDRQDEGQGERQGHGYQQQPQRGRGGQGQHFEGREDGASAQHRVERQGPGYQQQYQQQLPQRGRGGQDHRGQDQHFVGREDGASAQHRGERQGHGYQQQQPQRGRGGQDQHFVGREDGASAQHRGERQGHGYQQQPQRGRGGQGQHFEGREDGASAQHRVERQGPGYQQQPQRGRGAQDQHFEGREDGASAQHRGERRGHGYQQQQQQPQRGRGGQEYRLGRGGQHRGDANRGGATASRMMGAEDLSKMETLKIDLPKKKTLTRPERMEIAKRKMDLVPTRPKEVENKRGTSGIPVDLIANFFRFNLKPEYVVLKHRVDFNRQDLDDQTNEKKKLLFQVKSKLPNYVFDGTMMFTATRVHSAEVEGLKLEAERGETGSGDIVTITIKLVGEMSPTDHDYLHFFNVIWRNAMSKMKLQMIKRNFYDPDAATPLPNFNLQIWPGYITTVRQQEKELMLCAEITNRILRSDTAYDCIMEIVRKTGDRNDMSKALIGSVVITGYNNKSYRIDEVQFDENPKSSFTRKDGTIITYMDYFFERYGIKIRDPNQPLLISMPTDRDRRGGEEKPVALIPELSKMTGLTDEHRRNFGLTKELTQKTQQNPKQRVETLLKFIKRVKTTPEVSAELSRWDLSINPDLVRLKGRLLPTQLVTIWDSENQKQKNITPENENWAEEVATQGMAMSVEIKSWVIIYPRANEGELMEFYRLMEVVSTPLRVMMNKPIFCPLKDIRTPTYINALNVYINKGAKFFLVVVPNDRGDTYDAIKKKLYIEDPTPNQVVTVSKVLRSSSHTKLKSIATKVLIQIASKLKASPWLVTVPIKNAMVVGFDVYHKKEGNIRGCSVGALVASYDSSMSQYYSKTAMIPSGTEICSEICKMLMECLQHYKTFNNGTLPDRLFFYRDGVGQGQIQEVFDHEVYAIQKILKSESVREIIPNGIRLTFIIVNKRINTRFMAMALDPRGIPHNPNAGTIVDDVITCPERYDFLLVSQNAKQGTVNPTSYNVIVDESNLKPDNIQVLTYRLTYLYYNMSSTVRVPAPCLYAHRLAELVGSHLHAEAHTYMNDTLYYL